MVAPQRLQVVQGVVDMRATPSDSAELVDQLHHAEEVTLLSRGAGWVYVQADDHYFGWIHESAAAPQSARANWRVVAVPLAEVRERPEEGSPVVDHLPVGAWLPSDLRLDKKEWKWTPRGWVALDDTVQYGDLPHRPPTADDVVRTAEAFIGVPYLWGGTTSRGIDCSGYAQLVYRLNGVRLDRDAHQQAVEGRHVDAPARGDLVFFGKTSVTHVGIAVDERSYLNAPESGKKVQLDALDGARSVLAIRRYLA